MISRNERWIDLIRIDAVDYRLSFGDEFDDDSVAFWNGLGKGGIWSTSFSPLTDDTRVIDANNELQYYVDPDMEALPDPFSTGDGTLTIRASELTAEQRVLAEGQPFASGMIATEMSFGLDAGYIEMRADVPAQKGLWSAFWLLPADGDWSAELDIFEILGENPDQLHTNVWDHGRPDAEWTLGTGAGEGFHLYGVYWDEEVIRWYYDGEMIRESVNTIKESMYLIVNLAVGGWSEDPDATTDFDDGLSIDYIRIYERVGDGNRYGAIQDCTFHMPSAPAGTGSDDVVVGSRWGDDVAALDSDDTVFGNGGDDTLSGGAGDDKLFGQDGNDVLSGGPGRDHVVGGVGSDRLSGGTGTDHLWGGAYGADGARDVFSFRAGAGTDYIHDFEIGLDRIAVDPAMGGAGGLDPFLHDEGWATRIDMASAGGRDGDVIYVVGVTAEQIMSADLRDAFLF